MKWKILMSLLKMGAHKVLAHSLFYTKGKWIVTMVLGHESNALRSPWLTQGMFCIVFEAKVLKRLVGPKLYQKGVLVMTQTALGAHGSHKDYLIKRNK